MTRQVLVLLDVQNIFYGSLNYTNGKQQIDYAKLLDVVKEELEKYWPNDTVVLDPQAFVVQTPRYKGTGLFAFLRSLNYSLRSKAYLEDAIVYDAEVADSEWKGTVGSLMQLDLLDMAPGYNDVVVIAGSGMFEKAFKALRRHWPYVTRHICAFDNTLHAVYNNPGVVDNVIYLDERVLRPRDARKNN